MQRCRGNKLLNLNSIDLFVTINSMGLTYEELLGNIEVVVNYWTSKKACWIDDIQRFEEGP